MVMVIVQVVGCQRDSAALSPACFVCDLAAFFAGCGREPRPAASCIYFGIDHKALQLVPFTCFTNSSIPYHTIPYHDLCRVRPRGATGDPAASCVDFGDDGQVALYHPLSGRRGTYTYDKVFPPEATQEQVRCPFVWC